MAMKRLSMDEEAVSEVVGAILTLLITVILFTSVFATVQQLEGPEEGLHVEMEADFENSGGTNYINITHLGGKRLDADSLSFFLMLGDEKIPDDELETILPNEDDTLWRVGEQVSLRYEGDIDDTLELMIREDETHRIVYQTLLIDDRDIIVDIRNARIDYKLEWRNYAEPGEEIEIKALIAAPVWLRFDDFDPEDIQMNASISESGVLEFMDGQEIDSSEEIEMEYTHNNRFERRLNVSEEADDDRYRIKLTAEHKDENISIDIDPSYLFLNIGREPIRYYDEELEIGNLRFEPRSPSHGDSFTLDVEVFNEGVVDYSATWKVTDDRQEDLELSGEKTISHGPAPTPITVEYPDEGIQGHGPHEITFEIITDEDDDWEGDSWTETIYVDPNVMIVRDNLHQDVHEGELMRNALNSLNLEVEPSDIYSVGPDEEIANLEEEISQYSVAVWMVGNKTEEEPYLADVLDILNDYVEGELDSPLNGALWLVGSNLAHFSDDGFEEFGVTDFEDDPAPFTEERILVNPTGDEKGTYGDFEYGVSDGEFIGINDIKSEEENKNNTLVYKDEMEDPTNYLGVGYQADEKQRTAVNPFTFGSITDPGQRAIMAGEVIEWLSNMTTRTGVDVAMVSQRIEPRAPMFMDEITIDATLRNNGPKDLHVSVRAVRNQGEEILTPDGDDRVFLPKNGGVNTTSFTWVAEELGRQEFLVIADYFNEIDEVNLRNNDITYKNLDITDDNTEVNVHFSTLLVDADGSDLENNDYKNVTGEVMDSFDRLGHEEDVDYEYYYLGEGEGGDLEDGPDEDKMENYNAIVWVTGEREEDLFNTNDIDNINSYLGQDSGANMIFIGEHILEDVDNSTLKNYLGIENYNGEVDSDVLLGQKDNDLGHGLRYKIEEGSYSSFDKLNEYGEVLFKDGEGNNLASTYDDGSTRTVYMGVNLNRIEGPLIDEAEFEDWPTGKVNTSRENAREEFIYTSLWNFGKRDDRTELRVTDYDIKVSSPNPETGRSYQIDARIENIGYSGASALIRVREGRNHVASQAVFVDPSERVSEAGNSYFDVSPGSTTVEVSWNPMDGGIRPIRVRVDPIRSVDEIEPDGDEGLDDKIMEFNNQAIIEHPVYYFYDDMERGDGKWRYDSTMINIDGSSALDFLDISDLNTNIEDDWDWTFSGSTDAEGNRYFGEGGGVYQTRDPRINHFTDNASYSPPRSYWMGEGPGDPEGRARRPLDLILVFDDGQTMDDHLDDVIEAAKAAIDMLAPGDRVSIIYFGPGDSVHVPLSLNDDDAEIGEEDPEEDKETIKDYIPTHTRARQKSLLSAMSKAVEDLDEYGREEAVKGIVTLTDGASNQDAEEYKYAPGGGPGDETDEVGAVQWYDYEGDEDGGKGLLGIPYNIMTITISDLIEPRHHWVSATSTANIAYGILERETEKLEGLYEMFVSDLMESERGDLRSILGKETTQENSGMSTNSLSTLNERGIVENTEFFVYSDAFTTGYLNDEATYDWKDEDYPGYGIPGYGHYETFDFDDPVSGRYEKEHTDDNWAVVESFSDGEKISNTVYPRDTLDKLKGNYEVHGANANFFVETADDSSITLRVIQDGTEIFEKTGNTGQEVYKNIPIDAISNSQPFTFELIHNVEDDGLGQPQGYVMLDDLTFTYEIDYYPEDYEYDQKVGANRTYRYMTTPSIEVGDIEELNSATLEFQNRYRATEGTAGGFIYLWGKDGENEWSWEQDNRLYVEPEQSYTGNLNLVRIDEQNEGGGPRITGDHEEGNYLRDREGNLPYWVFNGKSADRTFDWTYTSVDVGRHEDFLDDFDEIRAVFMFAQFGGIVREDGWEPEMGWYVDNVRFKVSSDWSSDGPSYWNIASANELNEMDIEVDEEEKENYADRHGDKDGKYWIFTSEEDGDDVLPKGIDSSLYTHPIYLDRAEDPRLTAYMKFNLDDDSETLPPDGFRVEVSSDGGRTWESLTSGDRTASGTSGNGDYGWTNIDTLSKLRADLSGWRGRRILLRFRVFTNNENTYADENLPKAIFIDDVVVAEADMLENPEDPSETTTVLEENFDGDSFETNWETDDWEQSDTNSAGGDAPEARLNWEDLEGDHAYLTGPKCDTTEMSELTLNLRTHIEPFSDGGFDAKVLIRSDTDEEWTSIEPWESTITETLEADTYKIDISDHIGPETQIMFEFKGESWYLEDWFVNEVSLEGRTTQ